MSKDNKEDNKEEELEKKNDSADEGAPKVKSKKKLIIIATLIVTLIIIGVTLYMTILKKPAESEEPDSSVESQIEETAPPPAIDVYYDVDEFVINLKDTNKSTFLRLILTLRLASDSDAEAVSSKMILIRDNLNAFLRELRPSDVGGAAGIYQLKEEILLRINKLVSPTVVKEVLVKDILVT